MSGIVLGAAALPGVALHVFRAMNTEVRVLVAGTVDEAERAGRLVGAVFRAYEQCLSRFIPESPLSVLNRRGVLEDPPRLLVRALRRARHWHERFPGQFDPTVLPALEHAGYDRSFEAVAQADAPRAGVARVRFEPMRRPADWLLRADPDCVRLAPDVRVDLGGIGKGMAVDEAIESLLRAGFEHALVNAGGDIRATGHPPGLDFWPVAVIDPVAWPNAGAEATDGAPDAMRARPLREVQLRDAALATSSTLKRRWVRDGEVRHHLMDPRTGRPAISPWVSVSAWAPDAETADVAAKALLVAGPDEVGRVRNAVPGVRFLCVRDNGNVEVW